MKAKLSICMFGGIISLFSLSQSVYADYCPKCVKIESARAAEQSAPGHPSAGYYDDYIKEKSEKVASLPSEATNSKVLQASEKEALSNDPSLHATLNRVDLGSQLSTIFDVLQIKDLFKVFEGPFTLFVPSDASIQNFSSETFRDILKPDNRELLYALVTNHIVPEEILKNNFNQTFKTLGGRLVELSSGPHGLTVNGAKVLKSESIGKSGVVYVIDQILIPIYAKELRN